jgi:hypothetical protein
MKVSPTTVYLIRNVWSEANYKVGVTGNVPRRIAEIEEQYGVEAQLIDSCWFPTQQAAAAAEKIWHKILGQYQTDDHGGKEWFSLPARRVEEFRTWASLSMPGTALKRWLFVEGSSTAEVKAFLDKLFKALPKPKREESIDLWHNQHYLLT